MSVGEGVLWVLDGSVHSVTCKLASLLSYTHILARFYQGLSIKYLQFWGIMLSRNLEIKLLSKLTESNLNYVNLLNFTPKGGPPCKRGSWEDLHWNVFDIIKWLGLRKCKTPVLFA